MQTFEIPPTKTATSPLGRAQTAISTAWVIRRAALWILIVGLGVAGSCLLYMAAGQAEADADAGTPTTIAAKP